MKKGITVLVVEDDQSISELFCRELLKDQEITEVKAAYNGYQAISTSALLKPDVILMDIDMESKDSGLRASEEIQRFCPESKIIILTVCESDSIIFEAFSLGITDYLLKNTDTDIIVKAVKDVYNGNSVIHDGIIAEKIRNEFKRIHSSEKNMVKYFKILRELTPAEIDILNLYHQGNTKKEICEIRCIEITTIKTQVTKILKKFGMKSISEVLKKLEELDLLRLILSDFS